MIKHPIRLNIGLIIVLLIADYEFFSLTNPNNVPSFVLVLGFLLLLMTLYLVVRVVVTLLRRTRRRLTGFTTGLLGVLLALQSIGQLTTRDAVVIVPIAIVLYVYFTYARTKMRPQQ
jgi:TRAP-type uncharacterized transport system fused permease subunit